MFLFSYSFIGASLSANSGPLYHFFHSSFTAPCCKVFIIIIIIINNNNKEELRRISTPSTKSNSREAIPSSQSSNKLEGIQGGTEKADNATHTELEQENKGLDTRSNEGTPTDEQSLVQHVQEELRRISTPSTKSNSREAIPSSQSSNKLEGIQGGTETRKSTTPTELNRKYEGLDTKNPISH